MTTKKFYKSVITFEILSEEPIPDDMKLMDIIHETIIGKYCGNMIAEDMSKEINSKEAAIRLSLSGSDTEFFKLDKAGNYI